MQQLFKKAAHQSWNYDKWHSLQLNQLCACAADLLAVLAVVGWLCGNLPAGRLVSKGSLLKDCMFASSLCCAKFLLSTLTSRERSAAMTLAGAKWVSDWLF